jgi:hypothetical protein
MVTLLILLSGCKQIAGEDAACQQLAEERCDVCPQDNGTTQDLECTCLENRKLSKDDAPDGTFSDDDDAQLYCDRYWATLDYPTDAQVSSCQQELVILKEWGEDVCARDNQKWYAEP